MNNVELVFQVTKMIEPYSWDVEFFISIKKPVEFYT